MKYFSVALMGSFALLGCDLPKTTMQDPVVKDNNVLANDRDKSVVNQGKLDPKATTPLNQMENKTDTGITASIKKGVVDTEMSANAKNVKITSLDGAVTLRGPVSTEKEKNQLEEIARGVAGVLSVNNQLEVESNS